MQITDLLAQKGGLQSIARELGVDERRAASGVEALGGLLGQLGGGGLLDNLLAPQPTDLNRGNDLLGQIFGSKDVSRAVAGGGLATMPELDGNGNPLDDILRMVGKGLR